MFKKIEKRDGRIVDFDSSKITNAIAKAGKATGEFDKEVAEKLCIRVVNFAQQAIVRDVPNVEEIQDIVEEVLLSSTYRKTAKAYVLYRDQHARIREFVTKASNELIQTQ